MSKTRLDDLTSFMESIDWELDENGYTFEDNYINFRTADMLRQALTSLIKELVAEAKQEKLKESDYVLNMGVPHNPPSNTTRTNLYRKGYNDSLDQFEQNLLKALEEKQMRNGDIADLLFIDEDELDNDNLLKGLEEV